MNKHQIVAFLLLVLSSWGCKNEPSGTQESTEDTPAVVIESQTLEKKEGDCSTGQYDSKCAEVTLSFPVVTKGDERLIKNVSTWSNNFMVSMLDPGLEIDQETSLESALQSFIDMHREMTLEMPDMPAHYTVEVSDTLLMNDGKYLTLRLDGYSYTGGAHPNSFAAVATFDLETGVLLFINDLVTDIEALRVLAEEKFRTNQQEAFDEGFEFTESWPFKIADNVGLTTEGLFFCYVPYEVAPYAMGFTEFVIPYTELTGILKKATSENEPN